MSEPTGKSSGVSGAGTLLLVDDEIQVCAAIKRVLYRDGYRILTADSADEAMRLLSEYAVDVIISDHRMPRTKGTDFLREVQARYPKTVRLILSGAADIKDVASAMESAAIYKFLMKPIDPILLQANVREAFSRAEFLRSYVAARSEEASGGTARLPERSELEREYAKLTARSRERGQAICLLMVQVDQYQSVLSSFGQAFAQSFLGAIAEALLTRLAEGFSLAHDLGGRFLVLTATDDPIECISRINDEMETLFARPVQTGGRQIAATVSVGATVAELGTPFETAIDQAYTAMMTGSDRGGATLQLFQPQLIGAFRKKLEFESDLRQAVAEKSFVVYYQSQVEVVRKKIVGIEALIRWTHPRRGLVGPSEFISAAERFGLIEEISDFVLETAIIQFVTWMRGGIAPAELAINVSPLQIKEPSFADRIGALLARARLPARRLVLEITESAALEQEGAIAECLERLRKLGVRLAVDDFGTGYANLRNLTQLPFEKLKIDRSLLPKTGDERTRKLFANVVALSRELGLISIAEGIETTEELETVRSAGCGIVQGYLVGAPMDSEGYTRLLKRAQPDHRRNSLRART